MNLLPASSTELRPRFEGANVGTWIGFKHVMYLAEEACIQHLRDSTMAPGALLKNHNLGLEVVDSHLRLSKAIDVDDVVRAEVTRKDSGRPGELRLGVKLLRSEGGKDVRLASGHVDLAFRTTSADFGGETECPAAIQPYVCSTIRRAPNDDDDARAPVPITSSEPDLCVAELRRNYPNAYIWPWRVPYTYCHYTERVQHSGYTRILEEAVERFLRDRGIAIHNLLRERKWIPVVSEARVEVLEDAEMETPLYTVFSVEDIRYNTTWTARIDCYAPVGDELRFVATGRITHAYLQIAGRGTESKLVQFDPMVQQAFRSGQDK